MTGGLVLALHSGTSSSFSWLLALLTKRLGPMARLLATDLERQLFPIDLSMNFPDLSIWLVTPIWTSESSSKPPTPYSSHTCRFTSYTKSLILWEGRSQWLWSPDWCTVRDRHYLLAFGWGRDPGPHPGNSLSCPQWLVQVWAHDPILANESPHQDLC